MISTAPIRFLFSLMSMILSGFQYSLQSCKCLPNQHLRIHSRAGSGVSHAYSHSPEFSSRKILQHTHLHLSVSSSLRSAITGTQEVSFQDSLNADFDVQLATKKFRFSLIPKTFSELVSREAIHFMAEDIISFKQWVGLIRDIIA